MKACQTRCGELEIRFAALQSCFSHLQLHTELLEGAKLELYDVARCSKRAQLGGAVRWFVRPKEGWLSDQVVGMLHPRRHTHGKWRMPVSSALQVSQAAIVAPEALGPI